MHAATQFEIARLSRTHSSPHFLKFIISVPEQDTQGMVLAYPRVEDRPDGQSGYQPAWDHADYVVSTSESKSRFSDDARFFGGTSLDGRANGRTLILYREPLFDGCWCARDEDQPDAALRTAREENRFWPELSTDLVHHLFGLSNGTN